MLLSCQTRIRAQKSSKLPNWVLGRSLVVALVLAAFWTFAPLMLGLDLGHVRVLRSDNAISICADGRQILEYRFVESPHKPYLKKLFSPLGTQILRDSPSDHQHHHALMFALAADKVDFWGEGKETGTEKHRSLQIARRTDQKGLSRASFSQQLEWIEPRAGKALVVEHRTIEAYDANDLTATLLTWRSRLEPARGNAKIPLTGEHYFGLGMRFVESMDRGGRFFNSEAREGEIVRGSERLIPARWCAYTASADNRTVTVAIFDHPDNPRHPARMFTMSLPFAYLAATLNLWKEPMMLQADHPLELLYGVAAWDGEADAAKIESLYGRWVKYATSRAGN